MDKSVNKEFAHWIKKTTMRPMTPEQLRQYRGDRTREEFARFLNCSASAIVHWEGGNREIPAWVEEKCLTNMQVTLPLIELQALMDHARERNLSFEAMLADALRQYLGLAPSKQTIIQAEFRQPEALDNRVAEDPHTPPLSAEETAKQQAGARYDTKRKRKS